MTPPSKSEKVFGPKCANSADFTRKAQSKTGPKRENRDEKYLSRFRILLVEISQFRRSTFAVLSFRFLLQIRSEKGPFL